MKYNFSAGPAILPMEVIKESSEAIIDFAGTGLSVLEVSHRSKEFVNVLEEANLLIKDLLNVSTDYEVLFLTGGASSQFYMTALNILRNEEKAGYLDTGAWSSKAMKEAKRYGIVETIASSKDKNYSYIPKGLDIPTDLRYVHYTSNNTIYGTQYKELPKTTCRLIADMSSDIFSKPINVDAHDIIYAGAQKNLGPAGVTIVIVKKDILGRVERDIPTMLNYQTHVDKGSSYNTPPVFPIYCSMLTLRWLKKNGGVARMHEKNKAKAELLYNEIDRNTCFDGTTAIEDRSLMNVCFIGKDESKNDLFLKMCGDAGCSGLKGHRSVGGFRASIYNAMPLGHVEVLINVMQEFEKKHG